MDNFEYSIQLNDREWAEFFLASEECNLAPASLATAEEQCLSDIEQGDGHASPDRLIPAGQGSEPAPGTGSSAPRGVPGDTPLRWQAGGHLSPPELLSGSEDEAELGSVGRFLCESDQPGCPSGPAMPSAQRRQPPRPPAAPLAGQAGGTAQDNPGQDAAGEAAASEKGAARGSRDMETPNTPSAPEQGGDTGRGQPHGSEVVAQPGTLAGGSSPAPPARKRHPSASHSEPKLRGPSCDPPSPSPGAVQEEARGERAGAEQSSPAGSPSVVRPKVPGQQKKSRKQRGTSTAEGDREPGGAAAQGPTQGPGKAPPGSPMSSRKSKGKEKAAKAALGRMSSEEAAESKPPVPGPGVDEGDPAGSAPPRQKGKEPGAQSPGKTKATKPSKAGQAGGLGVRDGAPVIPDNGAAAPSGEACQGMPGKPLQPKITAAFRGDAAEGAWKDPAAEIPGVPAAEIPGVPAAEIPGVSAAEIPGVPAVKIPGVSAAEIPGVPAAEIPVVPAAEIPGFPAAEIPVVPAEIPAVPAAEIPGVPAVKIPGVPAAEIPVVPAAEIPGFPAAEIPRKPSEIPMVPSIEIPWEPAPEIPRKPSSGIPRSPPIDIPRNTAAGIPRVATPEIPWRPAPEIPRKLSPPCFADGASARSNTLDVTWPEMYDYFFCDSQEEEELGSSVEGRRSPLQREISWPELYEYFFNEPEGNRKKVKGKDRKRKKFSSLDHAGLQNEDPSSAAVKDTVIISVPEVCEHFFPETPRNRMGWRGIFSIAPASEVKRAVRALKSLLQRQIHPDSGQGPASQALVPRGSAEKFALVPLAPLGRGQVWPEGTAEDPRVLTHKDMCLVFCAFASWAVKTSDLQAPDAWKTMFLASFGTLSAIRYFRRQVREGQPRT
ncbi:PGC-1 and ERR-induced regulator in muscle protein 1 isoform X2 [Manacus candei]|uniref:PGC-1 and ERR-induced regulator in muscle protein 1 isoform X2 n=1 Tax=Manacus candei TaxID=415023 RepID=UPI0022275002|nr:PGC-1 and ERR-induced regulator in muscle protein 1 isoform X2 [Manacus candei]